ncbi:hypothetical protein JCM10213_004926 [Rhodosporidiobolus nylandii]
MRVVVVALLLAASASAALPNLPSTSFALAARQDHVEDSSAGLYRRHGDDEDEEDAEMSMHHGGNEASAMMGSDNSTAAAVTAEPSHNDQHAHSHHQGPALLELNETQVLLHHSPDPPAYYEFDQTEDGKPALLWIHVSLMCLAFFFLLPLSLFLKAGGSAISILPQTGFLAASILGLFFGQAYNALTPNMYEHSSHTSWGWATVVLAIGLNVLDVARFLLRFTRFGAALEEKLAGFKISQSTKEDEEKVFQLGSEDEDEEEHEQLVSSPVEMEHGGNARWSPRRSADRADPSRRNSSFSDSDTVFDSAGPEHSSHPSLDKPRSTRSRLARYGSLLFALAQRMLIVLAYIELCTGVAVWTGTCRERYLNGCLAHVIKGSIFVWYGMLTFARYLGGMSTLGWAWNRHPSRNNSYWSAEAVESAVILFYGCTNTWMERLGKTGAWSVKDVQHTSIAIMFWAAGALGMLLESRTVRSWLSSPAAQSSGRSLDSISPPASASFSFNPFPALVIGVTGAAMAAHAQTYQFQVDIHALWGNLLALFAILRFLTYFFLYLRPPASILPSRPPTEALASLFLMAGGVVFIESTEQVTFAAMRHNFADVMAFLCLTIAFVLAVFTWIAVLFAAKGWALKRNAPQSASARTAHAKSSALA